MNKQQASVDVLTGNKLIAEFMGRSFENLGIRIAKYHSSWDWLMPVVRKIIDLKIQAKKDEEFLLTKHITGRLTPILNEMQKIDIHNTWYCVVQLINWYNQNKQS